MIAPLLVATEDHFSGRCLKNTRYRRIYRLTNHLSGIIDYHHCSVVEVCNTLVELLTLFQYENLHDLARQIDGFQSIGQFIDIQHLYAAELRHLVEVEIVRHDLGVNRMGKFNQLQIDLTNLGIVIFNKLDGNPGHLLNSL